MKIRSAGLSFLAAAVVVMMAVAIVSRSAIARASDGVEPVLKTGLPATPEELKQILFSAEIGGNPRGVTYELHNGLRTRAIEAFVIHVEFIDPKTADKKVELDVFVPSGCPPLRSTSGQEYFFRAEEASKVPVTFTLKEVFFIAAPERQ